MAVNPNLKKLSHVRKSSAHFAEIYLHKPEQLAKLEPEKIKFFWAQRSWHPMIMMNWLSGISSNGEGLITYPDGSQRTYEKIDIKPDS